MPNELTPVDILEALRLENASVEHLKRVIQLQRNIIETQRETMGFMRKTIATQDQTIEILKDHIFRIT